MYEARFGLEGLPFQIAPDPHFHVDTDTHRAALGALQAGLARGDEFIALVGDFGAGKTMVARRLIQRVDRDRFAVVELAGWRIEGDDLLTRIAAALDPGPIDTALPLGNLMQRLEAIGRRHRAVLLVIDDAHLLGLDAVRRLAKLTAMRVEGRGVVHVCLVGRSVSPAFAEHVRVGRPLPIGTLAALEPLDAAATGAYVRDRLERVGWKGQPSFMPGTAAEIQAGTGGNPARINRLCGRLLAELAESDGDVVGVDLVRALATRLQSEFDNFLADAPTPTPAPRTPPLPPPPPVSPQRAAASAPDVPSAPIQETAAASDPLLNLDLLPDDAPVETLPILARASARALVATSGTGAFLPQPVTTWPARRPATARRLQQSAMVLLALGAGFAGWQWRGAQLFGNVDVRHVASPRGGPLADAALPLRDAPALAAGVPSPAGARQADPALTLALAPPAAGGLGAPGAASAPPGLDVTAPVPAPPEALAAAAIDRPHRRPPAHLAGSGGGGARVSVAMAACSLESRAMGLCRPARTPGPSHEPVPPILPPAPAPAPAPAPPRPPCNAAQTALGLCNP